MTSVSAPLKKVQTHIQHLLSFRKDLSRHEKTPLMAPVAKDYHVGVLSGIFTRLSSPVSLVVPAPLRVRWIVSELESSIMQYLTLWIQDTSNALPENISRPSSAPYRTLFAEMAPIQSLTLLYRQLIDLCFGFQFHLHYISPIIDKCFPLILEFLQAHTLKATAPHWSFIPNVALVEGSASGELKLYRHAVDERFDHRELHGRDGVLNEHCVALMKAFTDIPVSSACVDGFCAELTATYPYVKQSGFGDQLPAEDEQPTLLNDPNNDGYLAIFGKGWVLGGTVDGSGAGAHARLAANLLLATMLDLVKKRHAERQASGVLMWLNSHEVCGFLEMVCRASQTNISHCEECGATTVILYALTTMNPGDANLYRTTSPTFQTNFPQSNPKPLVLNYVIAGDAEGFWFSKKNGVWTTLNQPPNIHEGSRLNTSITPGGLGRSHGNEKVIYGAYLWPDYMAMKEQAPNAAIWNDFHSHSNNIHFGQVFVHPEDHLVFATDGFGDTVDPIQLFPRPKLILGFEEYDSWQVFVKSYPNANVILQDLKELAINSALSSTMFPFNSDTIPSTRSIIEACISHSQTVTKHDREMYYDAAFLRSSRFEKQETMQKAIEAWIERNWPRSMTASAGSSLTDRPFALPTVFVPFAKVDHLAIQVIQAKASNENNK